MKYSRRRAGLRRAGGGHGPTRHGQHTRNPGWQAGQHWVECQRCGLDYRVGDIKVQWDGLITCTSCWEPRHPQDFVRGVHDDMRPRGPGNPVGNIDDNINVVFPVTGTFNNELDATGTFAAPDTISDLLLWWDLSERDGNFVFSDLLRTVPITDGGLVRGVIDRSGNDSHATIDSDATRGTWNANRQNGVGALDCNSDPAGGAPRAVETDRIIPPAGVPTQVYTVVGTAKVAPADVTERHALFSMTQATGTEMRFNRTVDGSKNELTTIGVGTTDGGLTPTSGEWWMFIMVVDGASTTVEYGSKGSSSIQIDTPPPFLHDAMAVVPITFRFGAGTDGIPNIRSGWNEDIGEVVFYNKELSTSEKLTLLNYFNDKWDLTTDSI